MAALPETRPAKVRATARNAIGSRTLLEQPAKQRERDQMRKAQYNNKESRNTTVRNPAIYRTAIDMVVTMSFAVHFAEFNPF